MHHYNSVPPIFDADKRLENMGEPLVKRNRTDILLRFRKSAGQATC